MKNFSSLPYSYSWHTCMLMSLLLCEIPFRNTQVQLRPQLPYARSVKVATILTDYGWLHKSHGILLCKVDCCDTLAGT